MSCRCMIIIWIFGDNVLQSILSNFSEDELLNFLPQQSIKFAIGVSNSETNAANNPTFNKEQLAQVVASTKQSEFIFNPKLRRLLIDRLKPQLFLKVFPEFELSPHEVKPQHYNAAIGWSADNLGAFASKVGLQAIYQTEQDNDSNLESIAHIEPNYALYPYQQRISQDTLASLNEDSKKRVLIHLPTGAGKTRTAMNIAAEHLRASDSNTVLWLADREELCSQAFNEFKTAWKSLGNRSTTLYGFYSDSDESLGGIDSGFVVAGLHKFLSLRDNDSRKLQLLYKELYL